MAAVDYHGVLTELKSLLEADSSLSGIPVYVEEEPQFDLMGSGKAIVLVLDRRIARAAEQSLSQGKRTRWHISIGIWAVGYDGIKYEESCKKRDELLGSLDLVLMNNRTVGGKLAHAELEGGAFVPVTTSQGMAALAETVLTGEAVAIAT